MTTLIKTILLLSLLHCVWSKPANSAAPGAAVAPTDAYIVMLSAEAGTSAAAAEQRTFLAAANQLGINVRQRKTFSELVNAISLDANPEDVKRLTSIQGVKQIYPVARLSMPKFRKSNLEQNPKLLNTDGLTGVREAFEKLHLTGKGIKVGIIDTGVDYSHPALGGCFGKGCKVAYGYDFVGDDYKIGGVPKPDEDPMDCAGHGTHVAGIVGGKGTDFSGVAPDATLGAYKINGCEDFCTVEIALAALERAYKDGMDVINASFSFASSWAEYPLSLAVDKVVEKGVIFVASASNSGSIGLWSISAPSMAKNALSSVSYDSLSYLGAGFSIEGVNGNFAYSLQREKKTPEPSTLEVAAVKFASAADCTRTPLVDASVKGKLALIPNQPCDPTMTARAAQDAGAAGVMLYKTEFGAYRPNIGDDKVTIPVVGVPQKAGWAILEQLGKGGAKVTFLKDKVLLDNPSGGFPSGYSSWGPGPQLELRPDVGAPGGLVYSTWPVKEGSYATISGTSMSSPFTAGAVALYLQAKGKRNARNVVDAFKLTARPTEDPVQGGLTSVFKQGSGLLQLADAVRLTTAITPARLPLLAVDFAKRQLKSITITNNGNATLRYTLTHKPALTVNPWTADQMVSATPKFIDAPLQVELGTKDVVIRPGQSEKVNVWFSRPKVGTYQDRWLYSGYLVVTPSTTAENAARGIFQRIPSLRVAYGGMYGDYKQVKLIRNDSLTLTPAASSAGLLKFSFSDEKEYPTVSFMLNLPSQVVRITIVDASGKTVGLLREFYITARSAEDEQEFAWNGKYGAGNGKQESLSPGKYKLKIEAIHPLKNKDLPSEWETGYSAEFEVEKAH